MAEPASLSFLSVTAAALRADLLRAARLAELAMSAQPLFYEAVAVERRALVEAVLRQIAEPGFDMADVFVLRDGDEDVALVASVPLAVLASAQAAVMAALLKLTPPTARKNTIAGIKAYASGIEPIVDSGHYISRVAVVPARQGQGLGAKVLSACLSSFGPAKAHLHVHRDNAHAIALYRSLGFVARGTGDFVFPAFTRTP